MMINSIYFLLRLFLILALWAFIWHIIEAKSQKMRILRAALLVLTLLTALALIRLTGQ